MSSCCGSPCPLWVISGHQRPFKRCPLYPRKWTLISVITMSAMCQYQTHAPQQKTSLFDHVSAEQPERFRDRQSK
jgi:hypothetical protein